MHLGAYSLGPVITLKFIENAGTVGFHLYSIGLVVHRMNPCHSLHAVERPRPSACEHFMF